MYASGNRWFTIEIICIFIYVHMQGSGSWPCISSQLGVRVTNLKHFLHVSNPGEDRVQLGKWHVAPGHRRLTPDSHEMISRTPRLAPGYHSQKVFDITGGVLINDRMFAFYNQPWKSWSYNLSTSNNTHRRHAQYLMRIKSIANVPCLECLMILICHLRKLEGRKCPYL